MVATLILHSLGEYTSGHKVKSKLSTSNLLSYYFSITSALVTFQVNAPAYVDHVQTFLYSEMITAGPDSILLQTYNYNALNTLGLELVTSNHLSTPKLAGSNGESVNNIPAKDSMQANSPKDAPSAPEPL
ncbi:hypothetical protein GYMLUDRAFT_251653 [Collybiopsis luxurians FD-317 M1]|uniref:Uncharacterized protein n=1 Tax=Collybiopsis luxurians FD-317 M1 TaxID=944289 RepID=A0A0D0BQI3_9AGAR|nr:hypothetical protein GYMLUDRAFT_251653 [Collybiopsis luxurians FD-317 M1]